MLRKSPLLLILILLLALAACRGTNTGRPETVLPTPLIASPTAGIQIPTAEGQPTATPPATATSSSAGVATATGPATIATTVAVATIPATAAPPTAMVVVNSSVLYIQAVTDVNVRSGPGTGYQVVGWVAGGQLAKVTGTTADGTWWRVVCPDNSVGSCWVTAGTAYTKPAQAPATATAPANACTDAAQFVTDVTVPDGSQYPPRSGFVKTWRVRNSGTCTWDSSYRLVLRDGDPMGALGFSFTIAGPVAPGQTADLSASLVSPPNSGSFTGYWMLENGAGRRFGVGSSGTGALSVKIVVSSSGTGGGSISGFVWGDDNRNGGLDQGEGRANMTVLLFSGAQCQTQLQVTYTGTGGPYRFSDLGSGNYCVIVAGQTAYLAERQVDLVAGQALANVNPEIPTSPAPGTITGLVYEDQNNNRLRDAGEPGVGGLQVQAFAGTCSSPAAMQTTTTAADGTYRLYPVEPMMICVAVLGPRGEQQSTALIPLASNATVSAIDLPVVLATQPDPGTLTGVVYQDSNNNLQWDSGEPLVPGRDVWLYPGSCQGSEPALKTVSGADGVYTFKPLHPQQYCVELRGPDGAQEDMNTVGLPSGQIVTLNLRSGMAGQTGAAIGGRLWSDYCELNPQGQWVGVCVPAGNSFRANGLYENSEQGIAGVTMRLQPGPCGTDNPAISSMALTDAQGFYHFTGLQAGTYCVLMNAAEAGNQQILLPGDWTYPSPGIWYREVTLAAGEQRTGAAGLHFGWDYQLK